MKKLLLAVFLSAALISQHKTPINNLGQTAAITKPAGQVHPQVTAPAQVVKPAVTLATQTAQVQTVAQGCDSYRKVFDSYAWNVNTAIAICKAESNGNTNAISPSQDRGLMQINAIHADMVNYNLNALYNPVTNISVAYRVYLSQGWYGWTTYKDGQYLSYLE